MFQKYIGLTEINLMKEYFTHILKPWCLLSPIHIRDALSSITWTYMMNHRTFPAYVLMKMVLDRMYRAELTQERPETTPSPPLPSPQVSLVLFIISIWVCLDLSHTDSFGSIEGERGYHHTLVFPVFFLPFTSCTHLYMCVSKELHFKALLQRTNITLRQTWVVRVFEIIDSENWKAYGIMTWWGKCQCW